jgi:hypothetical protein
MAKRPPPKPKSTAGMPPSLAAYWRKQGVPHRVVPTTPPKK